MRLIIKDKKRVIMTGSIIINAVIISFDLLKDLGNSIKNETCYIVKHISFLAEHAIEIEIRQLLSKYSHGNRIYKHRKQ